MSPTYEYFRRIIDPGTPNGERVRAIRNFAHDLEWTPSYDLERISEFQAVSNHLVVEHGLENSAVITFLRTPGEFSDLGDDVIRSLLELSYNNLVDWHIFASATQVAYLNNLAQERVSKEFKLTSSNIFDCLSATRFTEAIAAVSPKSTVLPCDELLIQTISRWKRLLKADLSHVDNTQLSSLFNALILVRGCEDRLTLYSAGYRQRLSEALAARPGQQINLIDILSDALHACDVSEPISTFVKIENLAPFKNLDRATTQNLIDDFYRPSQAPYRLNFALMSKHALSRIYEKYIAMLEYDLEGTNQYSFINPVPRERISAKGGTVYTPPIHRKFFCTLHSRQYNSSYFQVAARNRSRMRFGDFSSECA